MALNDIAILALAVGTFTLFGGVLGWASWEESRNNRKLDR